MTQMRATVPPGNGGADQMAVPAAEADRLSRGTELVAGATVRTGTIRLAAPGGLVGVRGTKNRAEARGQSRPVTVVGARDVVGRATRAPMAISAVTAVTAGLGAIVREGVNAPAVVTVRHGVEIGPSGIQSLARLPHHVTPRTLAVDGQRSANRQSSNGKAATEVRSHLLLPMRSSNGSMAARSARAVGEETTKGRPVLMWMSRRSISAG